MILRWKSSDQAGTARARQPAVLVERLERRDLLALTIANVTAIEGTPLNAIQVASFNLGDIPGAVPTDFAATINWGDGGPTTTGTVKPDATGFSVFGTYTYRTAPAPSSPYVLKVSVQGTSGGPTSASGVVGVSPAALTSTGLSFTQAKGVAFAGVVAGFMDADTLLTSSDFTASINWGDGTTSAGLVSTASPSSPGSFVVQGATPHIFAQPGNFVIQTTITHAGQSTVAVSAATVPSVLPTISTTSQLVTATAGTAIAPGTVVGVFTYNGSKASPTFTAIINWGDGHTTVGTINPIAGSSPPSFQVDGGNTYLIPGKYPITITVQDQYNESASISSTAVVTGQVLTVLSGTTFAVTPGVPVTAAVATFTDSNPLATRTNTTAVIDWGDGHTSNGTITGPDANGIYTVTGTNTYATSPGPFTTTVNITDPSGFTGTATGKAQLTGTTVVVNAASFVAFPNVPLTTIVATFTDSNPLTTRTNTTAVISWGDGHTSNGTISGPDANGIYTVMGTNTYATAPGSFTTTVNVTDPSGFTGIGIGKAQVTATTLVVNAATFTTTPNVPFTTTVATFSDSNPLTSRTNTTAVIGWGDGHTSNGTISGPDANGVFTVAGAYSYPAPPASSAGYPLTVTVTDSTGQSAIGVSRVLSTTPAIVANGLTFGVMPGVLFTGTVASFTDSDPNASVTKPLAEISWGDGHLSHGTVSGPDANGLFTVTGANLYQPVSGAAVPSYFVTVTITDPNVSVAPVQVQSKAIVVAPTINVFVPTLTVFPGVPFTMAVATFVDNNPLASRVNTSAVIKWGDGHTSNGTISGPDGNGVFTVSGAYTYQATTPQVPNETVTVTVTDPTGASGSSSGTAVFSSSLITANGINISAMPGVSFTTAVASFADSNPLASSSKPTALIAWGDGLTTPGSVTGPDANSLYTVTGTHNYFSQSPTPDGQYHLTVTITDASGLIAIVHPTALVAAPAPPQLVFQGALVSGTLDSGTNRPIFAGTTNAFALVSLFARPEGVDATLPLGQTIADGNGHWNLLTGPLAQGIYLVTATVTPPGGSPSAPMNLGTDGLVAIDTVPPKVVGVSTDSSHTHVYVYFRDDLSGLSRSSLTNLTTYTFSGPKGLTSHPISANVLPSGGLPTDTQGVVLTLSGSPRSRRNLRFLRIAAAGIMDNAGNHLASNYHVSLARMGFGRAESNVVVRLGKPVPRGPRH